MLTKYDMRIAAKRALKKEGIKRFEKHFGEIKFLHPKEEDKDAKK